ncbi:MAG: putative manganese-dependent inorganic diphosphatase [Chloroflexota bacterium]|jgi:manganese-dependent inorganic pyrophosphatase
MSKDIYVVGHKKPDTDTISAAIAYAYLLRAMGKENVVPARQGDLRKETEYLLNRFSVAVPVYIKDVKVRVADVMMAPATTVNKDDSLYDVGRELQERDLPAIPVVDDDERLCGLIQIESFARLFMGGVGLSVSEEIPLNLPNVARALGGNVLVEGSGSRQWDKVFVGTMNLDTMVQRIEPDSLMVIGDRTDAQRRAIEQGISAIIVTGGFPVEEEILELARQNGVTVISSHHHTFKTVQLLNLSVPVKHVMTSQVLTAEEDELLDDVRPSLARQPVLPVVDPDGGVVGLLSRSGILRPSRRQVILVDHNERNQSIEGLEEAEIVAIIDHHRIYDIRTDTPIYVRIEPLGSTCTIVYKLFRENMVQIPKPIAGIMLGAILTDTIMFKSPTSTQEDRMAAEVLAQRAGVDLNELGKSVLAAASDVAEKKPRELLLADMKEFSLGDLRFAVSSVETVNAAAVAAERAELLAEMRALQRERGYASVILMIVDIAHEQTEILIEGYEREVAEALNRPLEDSHRVEMPGVLSRKKQIVPLLPSIRTSIERAA